MHLRVDFQGEFKENDVYGGAREKDRWKNGRVAPAREDHEELHETRGRVGSYRNGRHQGYLFSQRGGQGAPLLAEYGKGLDYSGILDAPPFNPHENIQGFINRSCQRPFF